MLAKRALVLMMMIAVMFAVTGCGGPDEPVTDPTAGTTPPPEPPPVIEEPGDTGDMDGQDMGAAVLNDVFYAFDQYTLSAESKSILEGNADELRRDTSSRVTIEGHCDERGTRSYNIALGQKRADAARDYLVSLGISASRLETGSMGKEKPFDTRSSESAWAKNRRAHIFVK